MTKQDPEEVKACGECGGEGHLDTSQGDFTTIASAIFIALAIYAIVPRIIGIRLGDLPIVIVYLVFVALVVIFWKIAETIKHRNDGQASK